MGIPMLITDLWQNKCYLVTWILQNHRARTGINWSEVLKKKKKSYPINGTALLLSIRAPEQEDEAI